MPQVASRVLVQVVLRDIKSTSPDCMVGAALGGDSWAKLHRVSVAEYGGGHGAAQVNVKPDGVSAGVQRPKPGQLVVVSADYLASFPDGIQAAALHHCHAGLLSLHGSHLPFHSSHLGFQGRYLGLQAGILGLQGGSILGTTRQNQNQSA